MAERVIRFGVANSDRSCRAATWRCWTNASRDQSVYLTCRELGGILHLSLHERGKWHVAFSRDRFDGLFEDGSRPASRFAGKWLRSKEIAAGWTLACRIFTPWFAVTEPNSETSADIVWIDAPRTEQMIESCVLIAAPGTMCSDWPGANAMRTSLIGSFPLGGSGSVWLVSRAIPVQQPEIPERISPRFFRGENAQSISASTLRALFWGFGEDGSVLFYDAPVNVRPAAS